MFKPFFLSNTVNRHFQSATDLHQQEVKLTTQNKQYVNTKNGIPQQFSSTTQNKHIIQDKPNLFLIQKQPTTVPEGKRQPTRINPIESTKRTLHQLQFLKARSPARQEKNKLGKLGNNQYGIHDMESTLNLVKSNTAISDSSQSCQSDGFFLRKNKKIKEVPAKPLLTNINAKIQPRNFHSKQQKCQQLNKNMARCPMFLRSAHKKFIEDSPLRVFSSQNTKNTHFNKQQKEQKQQKWKKLNQFKIYKKDQIKTKHNKFYIEQNKFRQTAYPKKSNFFTKGANLKMCRSLQNIDHDFVHNNSQHQFVQKKTDDNQNEKIVFKAINKKNIKRKISEFPNLIKVNSMVIQQKNRQETQEKVEIAHEQIIKKQEPQHNSAKVLLKYVDKLLSPKVKSDKQGNLKMTYIKRNNKLNTLSKIDTHVQTDNISNMSKSKSTVKIFRLTSIRLVPIECKTFQFIVLKIIAEHTNSQTYLVMEALSKTIYCLKKLKVDNEEALTGYINEYKIQSYIQHPYAVKLYGTFHDEKNLFLLMEYMEGESLIQKQKKMKSMTNNYKPTHQKKKSQMSTQQFAVSQKLDWIRSVLTQILKIISVLHIAKIIHRDVKPGNILVSHSTYKLGDFGSSTVIGSNEHIGTLDYAAPEILTQKSFDQAIDIWSLACIAYELDVGRPPFFDQSRQITKKNASQLIYNADLISDESLRDFIAKTLRLNPKERLSASQALKHQFLAKIASPHLEN